MFGDPVGGSFFGSETLDYFRIAIGPKNIDNPADSGVAFPRHESGPMLGHPTMAGLPGGDSYDKDRLHRFTIHRAQRHRPMASQTVRYGRSTLRTRGEAAREVGR